ncbi:MAG TPA: MarR family transcriptional regulator [Flavisolibacter sp.]|nr:MarR family transcriptional regulator [Flavisolibacter sp.]
MSKVKQEVTTEFTREVSRINLTFKQFIQLKLRQNNFDLTFEMLQILALLWRKDGINQQEIADRTVKEKASMTYLLDNLSKRKLVVRKEDEQDRRNKLIFLTAKGADLKDKIEPWVKEMYLLASKNIPIDKIAICIEVLTAMRKNLQGQEG